MIVRSLATLRSLTVSWALFLGVAFAKPTNVVLIMADDMGFEAMSANGSESCQTPNLDRLAATGIRFTNAFSNPICTPSRVKIMTGQYNVRNYVKFGKLDRGQTTFAHQLKKAGYATSIAGKWQLGNEKDAPQHFGFEQSCLWQHTRTGRSEKDGERIDRRFVNPLLEINGEERDFTNGEYGPQICADFICDFIEENKDKPFLVYYPMILTHCPFDPTPDSADWDPKRLGSATYKGDLKDPQRHFTEMVAYTDKIVGQIVKQLEESGIRENTLLIFTGDNGTDRPIVTKWNGKRITGKKGAMADAGHRVPMVANWPAGIEEPGRVSDDLFEFSDIMPTLCDVSGAELPEGDPGDGTSILPIIQNKAEARRKDHIYVWYRGQIMVRNRKYSLVAKTDGSDSKFTRYDGPFDGEKITSRDQTEFERELQSRFDSIRAKMEKTRLSSVAKKRGQK
ncbi:sulfatase-like hydrolase/transferase [Haloferula sp.]|uniref:sulfatase-like hydrolase/transferase n=1 Tax=Haloferula sp. TaxID=2497595 RepID=UPI00329D16D3